jgi:hypothetical protein
VFGARRSHIALVGRFGVFDLDGYRYVFFGVFLGFE